jgi:uncharacterized protein (TIGR02302 family)
MERRNSAALLPNAVARLPSRLGWWRGAARAALWAEWLTAHAWSQLCVLAAACGVAMLGLIPTGFTGPCLLLFTTACALLACVRYDWQRPPHPTEEAAERRLERDSSLPHQPFAVLRDHPATPDESPFWALHTARARASLARLRLRLPNANLPARDPRALRVPALLLLAAGIVVAGDHANERILAAFIPGLPASSGNATVVQAWIQPPAYTGLPPIFLTREGGNAITGAVDVPAGSKLSVSLTGGSFKPHLTLPGAPLRARVKFHTTGQSAWQANATITESGTLSLSRFLTTLGSWSLNVLPNTPAIVTIPETPGPAGKTLELKLPWRVAQRWGVAALTATLTPDGHPGLKPITLPVPLPGTPKDAGGALQTDLSAHPYAGLKMVAELSARDVSGQPAHSEPKTFTLPARTFHNGLARAIIELRRRLALQEETQADAADDLDALAQPPKQIAKPGTPPADPLAGHVSIYLNMVSVAALLRNNTTPEGIAEAQTRLWITALALDGALPEASQAALDEARAALRKGIEDRALGKITADELAKQLQRLRQALNQRLQDIAKDAAKHGRIPPIDPRSQFRVPSLDRMMRQMEQALREGRTDEAKERLAQMEKLMEQLKNARVLSPQEAEQARKQMKAGKQQTGAVQDMVQREAGLMDRAQARAPRPSALPPEFYPGAEPPPPPMNPDEMEANEESREADAQTQRALHQALDALKSAFGAGHKVPKSLDDASGDMQRAVDALKAGEEPAARTAEARAVDDLRKGGQQMAKEMQSGGGAQLALIPGGGDPGSDGDEAGLDPNGSGDDTDRDPLGRPLHQGTGGKAADDNSVHVPDKMEEGRSRAIQEELRRREANRGRPRDELDYIDRLLKTY